MKLSFFRRSPWYFSGSMPTASEVRAALDRTLGDALVSAGFIAVRSRYWVRQGQGPVRHIVEVVALKGASYAPRWGISLDYVPHVAGPGKVQWHRTLKSASLDLTYDPLDHEKPESWESWAIDRFMSARALEARCASLARKVLRSVGEFTEPLTSDSAVLEAYEAKRRRPTHRFGFENYYQDMLGYAFTLARVGRMTEAEEWLNRSVSIHWPDDADVSRELARLLHAAAGAPQER